MVVVGGRAAQVVDACNYFTDIASMAHLPDTRRSDRGSSH